MRRNGCPKGCFWRVRFFSAPLRFAIKTPEMCWKPEGGKEETDSPKTPFWTTVSPHDAAFAAPLARPHPTFYPCKPSRLGEGGENRIILKVVTRGCKKVFWTQGSDILFPYRSPSHRPHHDPTQHPRNGPETDPEQTRNGAKRSRTEPNGAKRSRNGPKLSFSGWDGRGGL